MNKRQAKKHLKKVFMKSKTSRKTGVGVAIITQGFVDKNGKKCSPNEEGARFIAFKRAQIRYYKRDIKTQK